MTISGICSFSGDLVLFQLIRPALKHIFTPIPCSKTEIERYMASRLQIAINLTRLSVMTAQLEKSSLF